MRFISSQAFTKLEGQLIYHSEEYSFDFRPLSHQALANRVGNEGTTSITIDTLQIEVDIESGLVLYVFGYYPDKLWDLEKLPLITPQQGCIKVITDEKLKMGVSQTLADFNEWRTIYDLDSKWICISSTNDLYQSAQYIEFADNIVAVLVGENLSSLWLKPFNLV